MIEQVEVFIQRLRNYFSRSRLMIRIFGLSRSEQKPFHKGLVIIQIDALSREQFEEAIRRGKLPFIKNLLDKQHYQLVSHYSGMPCSTASVQAELLYGIKSAVPAFSFYDYQSGRVFTMFNPRDALEIEHRLEKKRRPLLTGGSAYSDIYTGGAEESHFCISSIGVSRIFHNRHPLGFFVLALLHFYSLIRTGILLVIELCLAVVDFFRGLIKGQDLWKELKFVPSRVAMCVLLREFVVIGAKVDIARGMPVIHLNFMGYHEQSHRRGPTSRFAHWTLRGIDNAVKRIWIAAHRSAVREYNVWIYSDHGQIETIPYKKEFGKSVRQAVTEAFDDLHFSEKHPETKRIGFLARSGLRRSKFFDRIFPSRTNHDPDEPILTALGPMGHIYLKSKPQLKEIDRFVNNLLHQANIPIVILPKTNIQQNRVKVYTEYGQFYLPEQADEVFDSNAPFFNEMVQDFMNACRQPNCGDLMICGWQRKNNRCYTFAIENGSHGGLTPEEAEGFAVLPKQTPIIGLEKGYVRPLNLRASALSFLQGKREKLDKTFVKRSDEDICLKIMTYNVHGCVGMDGKLSVSRIAEVISQYEPDVVALQELDVGRRRSGKEDQAMLIAEHLDMDHHFHAAMRVEEEFFGDAILSSYPIQLVKKDSLSRQKKFSFFEPRGAIWVQLDFNNTSVQIINTHLGLKTSERLMHAKELLGEDWLRDPKCKGPVILCGDFNAFPNSEVFKLFHKELSCAQLKAGSDRHKRTWFGRYPVACLDHIFISSDFEVVKVEICDSYLARLASDHRPLMAKLKIKKDL
jgi:endonuclease/exonuclease/phosphatase family metal-dependent hydrolase